MTQCRTASGPAHDKSEKCLKAKAPDAQERGTYVAFALDPVGVKSVRTLLIAASRTSPRARTQGHGRKRSPSQPEPEWAEIPCPHLHCKSSSIIRPSK